jgi:hypothetical protein
MQEQIESLERKLDTIVLRLGRMGSSEPLSRRNGVEKSYGLTYQALVRLGARPQIKAKYRNF